MAVGRIAGLCTLVCLLLIRGAGAQGPLLIATEDAPPLNYLENGELIGPSADLVRALAQRAEVPVIIEVLPWARAYQQALDRPDNCVFSTTITEQRRPLFKWVGPLMHYDWVVYGRAETPIELQAIEDAKAYVIGVYRGDSVAAYLEGLGGFHLDVAQDFVGGLRQLSAGRVDLFAGPRGAQHIVKRDGLANLKELLVIGSMPVGLACNRAVPDATIGRLQAALEAMEADGKAGQIRRTYQSGL
jgi:polar amino acid transport system substrate-binding protein